MGNGFINSPITNIISLEIWRSPGELLKGAGRPDECPRGKVHLRLIYGREEEEDSACVETLRRDHFIPS